MCSALATIDRLHNAEMTVSPTATTNRASPTTDPNNTRATSKPKSEENGNATSGNQRMIRRAMRGPDIDSAIRSLCCANLSHVSASCAATRATGAPHDVAVAKMTATIRSVGVLSASACGEYPSGSPASASAATRRMRAAVSRGLERGGRGDRKGDGNRGRRLGMQRTQRHCNENIVTHNQRCEADLTDAFDNIDVNNQVDGRMSQAG